MSSIYDGCDAIVANNIAAIQLCVDSLNDSLHLELDYKELLKLSLINVLKYPEEEGKSNAFRLMGDKIVSDKIKPAVVDKATGEVLKPERIISKYYQTLQIVNMSKRRINKYPDSVVKQAYIDCFTIEHCFRQIKLIEKLKERDEELKLNLQWVSETFF